MNELKKLRIVFMGTPDFAVPMLDILHHSLHEVVAVITMPDKPAGRGLQLQCSDVKKYAVGQNIPTLQPTNLKAAEFIEVLRSYQADLFVVVAFRMLPEVVWNMPPLGTINLHASLLPNYRGAAPIHWAVVNGETETGVTTFFLQHAIDTGDIIRQRKVTISETDNVGDVYAKLMDIGKDVLLDTVNSIAQNTFTIQSQAHNTDIRHAPKIFKEHCLIDWSRDTKEIYNQIRGLSPFPVAYTSLEGKQLKVFKANYQLETHHKALGEVATDKKTFLRFYAKGGYIDCLEIQLEGKKRMKVDEFLRGWN
jgi:methionyl-tRNA formyltransferase